MINTEAMLSYDRIFMCGKAAREDLRDSCKKRGIEDHYGFLAPENVKAYLEVCKDVWDRWHTTNNFKVGDKVYVKPREPVLFRDFIRATVTEAGDPKWGYHLRAFRKDLPGIFMFNMWDKDLIPRTNMKRKFLPDGPEDEVG